MSALFSFIGSPAGRILRIIAGMTLMSAGLFGLDGKTGYILALTGFVPLLTGLIDICILAPLLGYPLRGSAVRCANNRQG